MFKDEALIAKRGLRETENWQCFGPNATKINTFHQQSALKFDLILFADSITYKEIFMLLSSGMEPRINQRYQLILIFLCYIFA